MSDHYQALGIDRDATDEQIKKAYRKLARELHPDVNPEPAAQERFKTVTHAYEVLSDPDARRNYDMGGSDPFGGAGGFGYNNGSNGSSNLGGGGGGGGGGQNQYGGNGGSGVVIIRYLGAQRATGGTVTSAGGYTYHTFTGSGTFTV